jgi:hypothetical protein
MSVRTWQRSGWTDSRGAPARKSIASRNVGHAVFSRRNRRSATNITLFRRCRRAGNVDHRPMRPRTINAPAQGVGRPSATPCRMTLAGPSDRVAKKRRRRAESGPSARLDQRGQTDPQLPFTAVPTDGRVAGRTDVCSERAKARVGDAAICQATRPPCASR